jgi:hypothetical protein
MILSLLEELTGKYLFGAIPEGFSSTICNMAGGGFSGLTSQTLRLLSCGSDKISLRNPARPHTSDRYRAF